jgi:hypothetical protein
LLGFRAGRRAPGRAGQYRHLISHAYIPERI